MCPPPDSAPPGPEGYGLVPVTAEQVAELRSSCATWSLGRDGGVACDLALSVPPAGQIIDLSKANVVYDDGLGNSYVVLQTPSAACDRGWQFTDATQSVVHLCQTTCDLILANPRATISLMFGCSWLSPPW
jgi:hypothetical protein